jgi:hypothetical protein
LTVLRRRFVEMLQRRAFGWYVLGYSPSSWSSLAGSLWNEKSGRASGRARNAPFSILRATHGRERLYLSGFDERMHVHAYSSVRCSETDAFRILERMAPPRHPMRDWIESMYRRGDLTSPAEGAFIATVPRQTVARWIREAGIDIRETRKQYLARNQRRALRYVAGKPPRNKPSKRYLRRIAAKALRDFNRAQSKRVAETTGRDSH